MKIQATWVTWTWRCWIGELHYAPSFGRYYLFSAWLLKSWSIAGFVKRENNCLTNDIESSEFASRGTKQRTSWPFSITSSSSRTYNLLFETQRSMRLFIYIKAEDSNGNIPNRAYVAQKMNWNSYGRTNCPTKKTIKPVHVANYEQEHNSWKRQAPFPLLGLSGRKTFGGEGKVFLGRSEQRHIFKKAYHVLINQDFSRTHPVGGSSSGRQKSLW